MCTDNVTTATRDYAIVPLVRNLDRSQIGSPLTVPFPRLSIYQPCLSNQASDHICSDRQIVIIHFELEDIGTCYTRSLTLFFACFVSTLPSLALPQALEFVYCKP